MSCRCKILRHLESIYEISHRFLMGEARMGKFSTDRTIREYAEEIWGLTI
ncbi:MAG: glycogen/starch/alpha-glucan phosphorylase [Deltaproteobacteria bacterium]|nr:glycogen/starch/alpha-glucan phosphorylase [Deltaproteobacteria bacterium]